MFAGAQIGPSVCIQNMCHLLSDWLWTGVEWNCAIMSSFCRSQAWEVISSTYPCIEVSLYIMCTNQHMSPCCQFVYCCWVNNQDRNDRDGNESTHTGSGTNNKKPLNNCLCLCSSVCVQNVCFSCRWADKALFTLEKGQLTSGSCLQHQNNKF